jgi:acetyl-CoA carboxylase biotin carboxyl carrier protein
MKEKFLKKLIQLVEESDIDSLEVSSWGRRVKITGRGASRSNGDGDIGTVLPASPPPAAVTPPDRASEAAPAPEKAVGPAPPAQTDNLVPIKSPMVGTFYAAPAPDAQPYVSLNERITVGQVVCIVEAMKLMNEIESEVSGRIVKAMIENGKPVEFGQALFLVEPDA